MYCIAYIMNFSKIFTIVFLLLCYTQSTLAVNDRHYIYLFDCTGSMTEQKVWKPAISFLDKEISRLDEHATVTIIPFQDTVYPAKSFIRSNYNAESIKNWLNATLHTPHRTTAICKVWDVAQTKLKRDRDNYIILLTDGKEETNPLGQTALSNRLKAWKNVETPNVYAFYVMLTPTATQIKQTVGGDGENLFFIDATAEIPTFAAIKSPQAIKSFQFTHPVEVPVEVSCGGAFKGLSVNSNDPHFKVELVNGNIENGKMMVRLTSKYADVPQLNAALSVSSYKLAVGIDGGASGLKIVNKLFVTITNLPERSLSCPEFCEVKPDVGTAHYYNKFLFWGESGVDTLNYTITPEFSPEAVQAGAKANFSVQAKCAEVFVNGSQGTSFTLDARKSDAVTLGILFDRNAPKGRHDITIKVTQVSQLECIQNTRPANGFVYPMTAKLEENWNPLKTTLTWLGIVLIVTLLLWFLVLKRQVFPCIKVGTLRISEPYFSQRKIKGARMVVLTDKPSRQSRINRLFTGRIIYAVNPVWSSPMVFERTNNGQVKMH